MFQFDLHQLSFRSKSHSFCLFNFNNPRSVKISATGVSTSFDNEDNKSEYFFPSSQLPLNDRNISRYSYSRFFFDFLKNTVEKFHVPRVMKAHLWTQTFASFYQESSSLRYPEEPQFSIKIRTIVFSPYLCCYRHHIKSIPQCQTLSLICSRKIFSLFPFTVCISQK